jgi:hypothetical protein
MGLFEAKAGCGFAYETAHARNHFVVCGADSEEFIARAAGIFLHFDERVFASIAGPSPMERATGELLENINLIKH